MADERLKEPWRVAETEIEGVVIVPLPLWHPVPVPRDVELGWTTSDHDETW